MHSALAFDHFPTRDCRGLDRLAESFQQRFSVHVRSDRQSEQRQNSRRDVEQCGWAENPFILSEVRTFEHKNSEWAVPDSRTARLLRSKNRSQIIAVVAVIGAKQNSGIFTGELQQPAEKHVVKSVTAIDYILIKPEVL